jgi:hypothetical protein
MDRREERRKHRLTYPGTTSAADSQQMLHEYRDAVIPAPTTAGSGTGSATERSSHERADSREKEHRGAESERFRRQTPPADGIQGAGSPRMQNRGSNHTPTKHLASSQSSSNRAHQNTVRKQNLEKIRRDLQPFNRGRERLSDPGFHAVGKETVDKKMLEELINNGYSEVRLWCVRGCQSPDSAANPALCLESLVYRVKRFSPLALGYGSHTLWFFKTLLQRVFSHSRVVHLLACVCVYWPCPCASLFASS